MTKLRALVEEVDAALEIHISARSDTRFNRTTFILADDAAELASKLFLIQTNPGWSDTKAKGRFKNFRDVTGEVRAARPVLADLLDRIEERRVRRNGFFHSTHLLDLTLNTNRVNHALVDLLDYCENLFGAEWSAEAEATASMEAAAALVRLDYATRANPALHDRVRTVLADAPRYGDPTNRAKGCAIVVHPADQQAAIAVRMGGKPMRDKLLALLNAL